MCADVNQDSLWSTMLSLYIYHLISYMNKFRNRVSVNLISVSCICEDNHIREKQVSCSPFMNDIFYGHVTVMNELFLF